MIVVIVMVVNVAGIIACAGFPRRLIGIRGTNRWERTSGLVLAGVAVTRVRVGSVALLVA